ncbi:MAG: PQQ-dependent sugar dehydrogenase [Pseudomonadota bacterium]|nr:PQQ-dependent sugar dehydrogenase [Pseudomonadota bacterium]
MPLARHTTGMVLSLVVLIAGCGGGGGNGGQAAQEPPPSSPGPPAPPAPNPPTPDPPAATAGLDARPGNSTCIAPARATGSTTIGTERVFPNLRFRNAAGASRNPLQLLQAPNDRSRWFVVERFGAVKVFDDDPAVATSSFFLDIGARVDSSCSECGLLGMAFHPDFPATPRVYLVYTSLVRTIAGGPDTHLSEFSSSDGGLTLDPGSERVVITIPKGSVHHHGGGIIFGRDDYLYFATGDGNSSSRNDSQDLGTLLGKVLRIDIRGTTGSALYRIPPDNPFAASTEICHVSGSSPGPGNCPEVWAWGLRNPWRWSFDRETGDLWLGDVGEREIEEVNRIVRGGNYGWRCFEGSQDSGRSCGTPVGALLPPIAEYTHQLGQAVTGGYVYRGTAIPSLVGKYLFADFVSGRIWNIPTDTAPTMSMGEGFVSGLNVSSFAEDPDGEIYIVNMRGDLHRLTGSSSGGGPGVATTLSATGCVNPANPTAPASGLIPYTPSAPFWSDGAAKQRWMALPDGQNIIVGDDGDWDFPNGTVLVKNFSLNDRLIETRLFMRHPDGVWAGYSYEWNAQGNDATLVRGGKRVTIGSQEWIYPSEAQCMQCHTDAAGRSLGLETKQLAFNINYPQTGRTGHQLLTLNSIHTLSPPLAAPASEVAYPNPTATAGTLNERARAYLHTNCSQCHRPGGPTTANMDLRYSTPLADTNACDATPGLGELNIANARLIAPGAPDRSVIAARMNLRDHADAMPPNGLGTRVDTAGVQLIRDWITSLASCN